MQYYDNNDVIDVKRVTKVIVSVTTSRNVTLDKMDLEFLVPKGTSDSYFHMCKVEISSVGRNMPCFTPAWYNDRIQYISE